MLMRLNYVIVYCSDMKRSVAFYRDQLGFPLKQESLEWSEFHSGAVTLALHIGQPAGKGNPPQGKIEAGQAQFSLEVLDLGRFYQEKKAKGVEFIAPPVQPAFGAKMAVLLDPDGLAISVTEEIR